MFLESSLDIEKNIASVDRQSLSLSKLTHAMMDGVCNFSLKVDASDEGRCYWAQCRYNHADFGDYVRKLGTKIAIARRFDAVTYLDADNYWDRIMSSQLSKLIVSRTKI